MRLSSSAVALFGTAVLAGTVVLAFNLPAQSNTNSPSSSLSSNRRDFLAKSAAATASIALPGTVVAADETDLYAKYTTTESGMKYLVTKEGTGAIPVSGQTVKADYTGWLDGFESEKKFDSSRDRGKAFQFKVGAGQVIRGWDEAFGTMKIGERRNIVLPSRLAYGDRGAGGVIPGGATLYFDVELLGIL